MFTELLRSQRAFFETGATMALAYRLQQLDRLENAIHSRHDAILLALQKDLGKSETEAYVSEIALLFDELHVAKTQLARWMKPRKVSTPLHLQPGTSEIHREPLGVVLIIGPWNYPFQLAIAPLIGAIAAGNCAVVKPSELAQETSRLITDLIKETFDTSYITAIEGGVQETTSLLQNKFDHIFFTGSTKVGQIVYEAAAKNLTPVTLELGGKSPAVVCEDADLDLAARRITWGKFMNAGQTCVAPDYVYAHDNIAKPLLEKIAQTIEKQFGKDALQSESYGRVINSRNFDRLMGLLDTNKIYLGCAHNREKLYIAPTVLHGVEWTDNIMQEEIFGPLLPVLTFKHQEDAIREIRRRDKPLAAYFFSNAKATQDQLLSSISFGGGCVNDTIIHLSNPHLPFGGVGPSGTGSYHGEKSFLCFSHGKSVMRKSKFLDLDLRYPPYSASKLARIRQLLKWSRKTC